MIRFQMAKAIPNLLDAYVTVNVSAVPVGTLAIQNVVLMLVLSDSPILVMAIGPVSN
jgi:hypothetical protein